VPTTTSTTDDLQAWRDQVAAAVRSVIVLSHTGGGKCAFRALIGKVALGHLGVDARIEMGSALYRAGPDPVLDTVGFCGAGNRATIPNGYHMWLEVGGDIVDFSCGDWYVQNVVVPENDLLTGQFARPIQWDIKPPSYVWRPARELTNPWRPDGEPELGIMWYRAGVVIDDTDAARARARSYFQDAVEHHRDHVKQLWPAVKERLPPPLPRQPARAEARRLRQMAKRAAA